MQDRILNLRVLASDATSSLKLCGRASVCRSGKGALNVAFRAPRDEGRSFRRRAFEVS